MILKRKAIKYYCFYLFQNSHSSLAKQLLRNSCYVVKKNKYLEIRKFLLRKNQHYLHEFQQQDTKRKSFPWCVFDTTIYLGKGFFSSFSFIFLRKYQNEMGLILTKTGLNPHWLSQNSLSISC